MACAIQSLDDNGARGYWTNARHAAAPEFAAASADDPLLPPTALGSPHETSTSSELVAGRLLRPTTCALSSTLCLRGVTKPEAHRSA